MKLIVTGAGVIGAALLLSTIAPASAGCVFVGLSANHHRTEELRVAHRPGTALRVSTSNGGVTVARDPADEVTITARLSACTRERVDAARVVAVREADGTLAVSVEWPEGRRHGSDGCSFEIRLPDAAGIEIATSNGGVSIGGFAGRAELRSSNGSIKVRSHQGDVHAGTSNGGLEIEGVSGEIVARTSNGSIRIGAAAGPVRASTSNGSVSLDLGPAFSGELTLDTSNGRVHVDPAPGVKVVSAGRTSARVAVGDQGPASNVETSNGGIRVRFDGR